MHDVEGSDPEQLPVTELRSAARRSTHLLMAEPSAAEASSLSWALMPVRGGLLLMGFARVMILLGSINRALRGPA